MEGVLSKYSCELKGLDFKENDYIMANITKMPFILTLYTKSICNLRCPSCFINSYDEHYSELNETDYLKIIQEVAKLGIKTIKVSGAGEPLIVKETLTIIKEASCLGITTIVYTNGSSIANNDLALETLGISSLELVNFLKIQKVSIVYKFNSIENNVQDFMVGKNNYSHYLYAGLLKLIYFGFNIEKRLAIQTIITPYNYSRVIEMYKFCRENNIIPYFETVLKKEKASKNSDLYLANDKIRNIFEILNTYDKETYNKEWIAIPSFIGFQCTEIVYGILINNFGYVQLCPGISKKMGNIREQKIFEIWNEETYKNIRQSALNLKGLCKICKLHNEKKCFYGCRAHAYINTGEINGEYSECWHGAE